MKRLRTFVSLLAAAALALAPTASSAATVQQPAQTTTTAPVLAADDDSAETRSVTTGSTAPLIVVLDLSSSMNDDDGTGNNKLLAAHMSVEQILRSQGSNGNVGVWGYPSADDSCSPGSFIVDPTDGIDVATAIATVNATQANGDTPTGLALQAVIDNLEAKNIHAANVVLVSDGESNCSAPPCPVAQDLVGTDFLLTVDAVGFQQSDSGRDELSCVANATGGRYFDAENADELRERLDELGDSRFEVDVAAPARSTSGSTVTVTTTITNLSSRPALNVKANLAFHASSDTSRLPAVIPPTLQLSNLPPGESDTKTWQISTSADTDETELHFRVTAWAEDFNASIEEGDIELIVPQADASGLGDVLAGVRDEGRTLVIMGDSFSSGEGTNSYLDDGSKCHRSISTYLAPRILDRVKVIACSGAQSQNFSEPQYEGGNPDDDRRSRPQLDLLEEVESPGAVVMTLGGNDIGFADIIRHCVVFACTSDPDWMNAVADSVAGISNGALPETYERVWNVLNSDRNLAERDGEYAPIIVLGYPQVTHDGSRGRCSNPRVFGTLNAGEVVFANGLVNALNAAINRSVTSLQERGFAIYFAAPTQGAFLPSHTVCDEESFVNGIQLGAGVKQESMHPNVDGYEATTEVLVNWINGIEPIVADPQPGTAPTGDSWIQPFRDLFTQDRTITDEAWTDHLADGWNATKEALSRTLIIAASPVQVSRVSGFLPGATVRFVMHSAPTTLGTLVADENGEVSGALALPASVPLGPHTLTAWSEAEDGSLVARSLPIEVVAPIPDAVIYALLGAGAAMLVAIAFLVVALVRRIRSRRP